MIEGDVTFDDSFLSDRHEDQDWIEYFEQHLGKRRFKDVLRRMRVKPSSFMTERDLAKITVCVNDVKREDIQEVLTGTFTPDISKDFLERIKGVIIVEDLDASLFHDLYQFLSSPFPHKLSIKHELDTVEEEIHNSWEFAYSSFKFEPYWYSKKRLQLLFESHELELQLYYERLAAFYAACEDIEVGCYLPAPKTETYNYYRVVGQVITGMGQIGMFLKAATHSMNLKPIRVTRGTPASPSALDFWSHILTDMEPEIGRMGYESGLPYQSKINEILGGSYIELGYSIGGTIAQWRISEDSEHIDSLWLYKAPGVPKAVWEKFNMTVALRSKTLDVHVFSANRDVVDLAGEFVLGYNSPENVNMYLYQMNIPRRNSHRYGFVDPEKIKVTKLSAEHFDRFFEKRHQKGFVERFRKRVGLSIVFPFFNLVMRLSNRIHTPRTRRQIGLWYEKLDGPNTNTVRYVPKLPR